MKATKDKNFSKHKIDPRSVKLLVLIFACVFGLMTIVAAPAVFAGNKGGTKGGNFGEGPGGTVGLPPGVYTVFKFLGDGIFEEVWNGEPIDLTDTLQMENIEEDQIIHPATVEGESIVINFNPFAITAVREGVSTVTLRADTDTGDLTATASFNIKPNPAGNGGGGDKKDPPEHPEPIIPAFTILVGLPDTISTFNVSRSELTITVGFTIGATDQRLAYAFTKGNGSLDHFTGLFWTIEPEDAEWEITFALVDGLGQMIQNTEFVL